jgi:hypothetical protein
LIRSGALRLPGSRELSRILKLGRTLERSPSLKLPRPVEVRRVGELPRSAE